MSSPLIYTTIENVFLPENEAERLRIIEEFKNRNLLDANSKKIYEVYDPDISQKIDLTSFENTIFLKCFDKDTKEYLELNEDSLNYYVDVNSNIKILNNVSIYQEIYDSYTAIFKRNRILLKYKQNSYDLKESDHNNIVEIKKSGDKKCFIKIGRLDLEPNYTYIIRFEGVQVNGTALPSNSTDNLAYEIKFFFEKKEKEAEIQIFSKYFNNIYTKILQLGNLSEIDFITSNYYNYEYYPTQYNPQDKTYTPVLDENYDKILVKMDNRNEIENLFYRQWLPEYERYFNDLKDLGNVNGNAPLKTPEEINAFKELFLKNSVLINTFKGNKIGMEYVYGTYSESLSYSLISIDPDPYENFVYWITSNMPQKNWESSIKPIVHPCGWGYHYVWINIDPNLPNIGLRDFQLYFLMMYHRYQTYLDLFNSFLDNMREGSYHNSVTLNSTTSHLKHNLNDSAYNINLIEYEKETSDILDLNNFYLEDIQLKTGYFSRELMKELHNKNNYILNLERIDNRILCNLEYKFIGVGTKYVWKVFRRNSLVYEFVTSIPKLYFEYKEDERYYRIQLFLKQESFSIFAGEYDLSFYEHALLKLNNKSITRKIGVLDGLNYMPIGFGAVQQSFMIYDDVILDEKFNVDFFEKRKNYNLHPFNPVLTEKYELQNLGNYTHDFLDATRISIIDSEIDYSQDLSSLIIPFILSMEAGNTKIEYPNPGIATKYFWKIFKNTMLINEMETSVNYIKLDKQPGFSYNIQLMLKNGDWNFSFDQAI